MKAHLATVVRPVRFGLLTDTSSADRLLEAVRLNSYLWGGTFNPVVPSVSAVPALWAETPFGNHLTPEGIFRSFLGSFDPDMFVEMPGAVIHDPLRERDYISTQQQPVLSLGDIDKVIPNPMGTKYGITVLDVARIFIGTELHHVLREPVRLVQPKLPTEWQLLQAVLYGDLADEAREAYDALFADVCPVEYPKIDIDQCLGLERNEVTLRALTQYGVRLRNDPPAIYLLHATEADEILDFLTVRAQGIRVLPVPLEAIDRPRLLESVRLLNEPNPTNIYVSPRVEEEDLNRHLIALHLSHAIIHFRHLNVPLPEDAVVSADIGSRRSESVRIGEGRVTAPVIEPFDGEFDTWNWGPRFANDVEVASFDFSRLPAQIMPPGLSTIWPPSDYYHLTHGRISSAGITYYPRYNSDETFPLPDAQTIVRGWYDKHGWQSTPSDEGLRAAQVFSAIGGVRNGWSFVTSEAFDILTCPQYVKDGVVLARVLHDMLKRKIRHDTVENLVNSLLWMNIIEIGLCFQCPTCRRQPWYSLGEANAALVCKICRARIEIPQHKLKEMANAWAYRLQPPLNDEDLRSNLLGIFGAAGFFVDARHGDVTLGLGLNVEKNGLHSEVDLTILTNDRRLVGPNILSTVFIEAKGLWRQFDKDDIVKFERLRPDFPTGTFVFSTLRTGLEDEEKVIIRDFVGDVGYGHEPHHNVVILTRNEMKQPFKVEKSGGIVQDPDPEYTRKVEDQSLLDLGEATRARYL